MEKPTDIANSLYKDEVVAYLADRYHTSPLEVVRQFLFQEGNNPEKDVFAVCFQLEENEMEMLRGLSQGITIND